MTDYLPFIRAFAEWHQEVGVNVQRELEDMEGYLDGSRVSPFPLGSKFFLNRGRELDELRVLMEQWGAGVAIEEEDRSDP